MSTLWSEQWCMRFASHGHITISTLLPALLCHLFSLLGCRWNQSTLTVTHLREGRVEYGSTRCVHVGMLLAESRCSCHGWWAVIICLDSVGIKMGLGRWFLLRVPFTIEVSNETGVVNHGVWTYRFGLLCGKHFEFARGLRSLWDRLGYRSGCQIALRGQVALASCGCSGCLSL